jgi:hypothetical protein
MCKAQLTDGYSGPTCSPSTSHVLETYSDFVIIVFSLECFNSICCWLLVIIILMLMFDILDVFFMNEDEGEKRRRRPATGD